MKDVLEKDKRLGREVMKRIVKEEVKGNEE